MKIQICNGKSCKGNFSEYIIKRLESDIQKYDLKNVIIEQCMCLGECKKGPNILVDGKIQNYMNPIKASNIILK